MIVRYLRARRVPAALLVSAGSVGLVVAGWELLAEGARVFPVLAVLTAALAIAPLTPTLAGNDAALERTAALPWPPRRVAHLIACGVAVAGLLYAARLAGADFGAAGQIVRNAAGLAGLAGLTAGLFGAAYAWQLPVGWTAVQCVLSAGSGSDAWRSAAVWMLQPADDRIAAVTAALLLLAGLTSYAIRGGPPVSAAEAPAAQ